MNKKEIGIAFRDPVDPSIVFTTGVNGKEVMRIDKRGVTINPDYPLDEAAQYVINALDKHIKKVVAAPVLSAGPITPEMANWSEADKAELTSVIAQHMAPQPAQRKPLTDGEIDTIRLSTGYAAGLDRFINITRAIEAAHGIKENT